MNQYVSPRVPREELLARRDALKKSVESGEKFGLRGTHGSRIQLRAAERRLAAADEEAAREAELAELPLSEQVTRVVDRVMGNW